MGKGKFIHSLLIYILLSVFLFETLFPFYWMVLSSFKGIGELYLSKNPLWLYKPTLLNYQKLLSQTDFVYWFRNTMLVGVVVTLISICVGILAAFSLTRLRYRGRDLIKSVVLLPYLVPRAILFLPLYKVVKFFGVYDSILALILVYPTFTIPFSTWLLIGYFETIPIEIEECARVDGCTRLGAFFRVSLPLTLPGVIAALVFSFTLTWTEYIYALTFISRSVAKTIPVGVSLLQTGDVLLWGQLMAAATLASFPIAFFYSFFQKHFVSGLTAGAVKG